MRRHLIKITSTLALALGLVAGGAAATAAPAEAARSVVYTATYTTSAQCWANAAQEPRLGGTVVRPCYPVKVNGGGTWWRYEYVLR